MMKKIILAVGLMFGGIAFVNAQEQTQDSTSTQGTQQSDQYRTDTTSVDDNQHQEVISEDSTQQSTEQSDMYRTEGNTTDSTSVSGESNTSSTSTGTESTTTGTTGSESSTGTSSSTETSSSTGATSDDQMSSSSTSGSVSQDDQEEGEKIEISELPAAVSTKLESTDYQGWVVSSARKKMWSDPNDPQAASKEVYVIEAKNGSETKKLKFDKDGNEIEHDKNKKDDQK